MLTYVAHFCRPDRVPAAGAIAGDAGAGMPGIGILFAVDGMETHG